MDNIKLKRIYGAQGPFNANDILVDRLWPRGITKASLEGMQWIKTVAPSNELRKWYHQHLDKEHWPTFSEKYQQELNESGAWAPLYEKLKQGDKITLYYGSKDENCNHAIVLQNFLLVKLTQ